VKQKKIKTLKHQLFQVSIEIIEEQEGNFLEAKAKMGQALRDDYMEEQDLRVEVDAEMCVVQAPYIHKPIAKNRQFTLVLDLDETLVHYKELSSLEGELRIRPGASSFLKIMAKFYELIIFTAGVKEYADWALSHLEGSELVAHRLYRQHASPCAGFYVKDLSKIGREVR